MKIGPKPDRLASLKARFVSGRRQPTPRTITWRPPNQTKIMWLIWLILLVGLIYPLLALNTVDATVSPSSTVSAYHDVRVFEDRKYSNRWNFDLKVVVLLDTTSTAPKNWGDNLGSVWYKTYVGNGVCDDTGSFTEISMREASNSSISYKAYHNWHGNRDIFVGSLVGTNFYGNQTHCFKVNIARPRAPSGHQQEVLYRKHTIQPTPSLAFTAAPPTSHLVTTITDLGDVTSSNKLYVKHHNRPTGVDSSNNWEYGLKSGTNGSLVGSKYTGGPMWPKTWGYKNMGVKEPSSCSGSDYETTNFTLNPRTGINYISNIDKTKWYCFRVSNTLGLYGYAKIGPAATTIKPPDITFYHLKDNSGDYQIQIIDKQKRDSTTNVSFSWRQIATGGQCDSRLSSGGWTTSTSIKPLTGDANIAYPVTSPKRSWMSSPIDASVGSIGRKAICARVIARAGTASQSDYAVHDLQPSPNIVFYRDSAGTNQIEYFSELSGATNFYYGIDNSVGLTGLKEVGLQSGHDGYLDQRFDSDSQYTTPNRWGNTWRFAKTNQTNQPDCAALDSTLTWQDPGTGRSWTTGNNFFSKTYNKSHWLCFRVSSTLGDVGYGAIGPGNASDVYAYFVRSADNPSNGADGKIQLIIPAYATSSYKYALKPSGLIGGCSVKVGDKINKWHSSVEFWGADQVKQWGGCYGHHPPKNC